MNKRKQLFSCLFTILFCVFAFALMTFFAARQDTLPAERTQSDVPKNTEKTNVGILFKFPFDSVFINLENNRIFVYFSESENDQSKIEECGYEISKTVKCDYEFLGDFIDRLGGIELKNGGEYRYTGFQVAEMLKSGVKISKKEEITRQIFKKISQGKLGTDELKFILENTQSDLSFPQGYDLLPLFKSAANNLNFINQEE